MNKSLIKSFPGIYFIVLSFTAPDVSGQTGGVSINTTNAPSHPSAILDVSSTSSPYMGMLIPRMTTANRNSIISPATGLQIFNTDCGINEYYTGNCWISLGQNLKMPDLITCSGTTDFCANETRTFSIPPLTGATAYKWTVPAGAAVTSGQGTTSVTIFFGNNSGDVCVTAENLCETSLARCINIHINPVPPVPGNITGLTALVPPTTATYFIASVAGAGVYNWTVPSGATIISGIGTTTITVHFSCGAVSGNITVSAQSNCGTSSPNNLALTVTPVLANAGPAISSSPGTLGGSPTASGGTSPYTYAWDPSTALSGTTVTNPTTTVCAATTYTVTVTDANGCIASSSTTASMFNPVAASAGPDITTPGTLGGLPTASGGASPYTYAWLPSTALSSITVSNPTSTVCPLTTYTVTVTDVNGCTASSSTTASNVNSAPPVTPGLISGSTSVCANDAGVAYSINPVGTATSYTWTVPSGASITSGQGANSLVVTFGPSSGNITVTATNSCGTSGSSSQAITVNSLPVSTFTLISGYTNIAITFTPTVSGATYSWTFTGGSPSTSTAENPSVTWSSPGTYSVSLTVTYTSTGCATTTTNQVVIYAPLASCQAILTANPGSPSGVYTINPGSGITQVYCDMTTDGGGWMLVFRGAPNQGMQYNDSRWSSSSDYQLSDCLNPSSSNACINGQVYSNTPVNQFRTIDQSTGGKYINTTYNSSSPFLTVIGDGNQRIVSGMNTSTWNSALGFGTSNYCNSTVTCGFNVVVANYCGGPNYWSFARCGCATSGLNQTGFGSSYSATGSSSTASNCANNSGFSRCGNGTGDGRDVVGTMWVK